LIASTNGILWLSYKITVKIKEKNKYLATITNVKVYLPDDPLQALKIVSENKVKAIFDKSTGYAYSVDDAVTPGLERLLDNMANAGFLQVTVEDNNVLINGKLPVYETLTCPECGSPFIFHESLAQHNRCGTVLPLEAFKKNAGFFCPACNTEITEEELVDLGSWYTCHSCGARFQFPIVRFSLENEHVRLGQEDIAYKKTYRLTSKGLAALNAQVPSLAKDLKTKLYGSHNIFFIGSIYGSIGRAQEVHLFFESSGKVHLIVVLKGNSKVTEDEVRNVLDLSKSNTCETSAIIMIPDAEKSAIEFLRRNKIDYIIVNKEDKTADTILTLVKKELNE